MKQLTKSKQKHSMITSLLNMRKTDIKIQDVRCEACGKILHIRIINNAKTKGERVACIYCNHINILKD